MAEPPLVSGPRAVRVRAARDSDAEAIAALDREAFSPAWERAHYRAELRRPHALVLVAATPGASPAGFVSVRCGGGEAEILRLAVAAGERRRGLGRLLTEAALARLAERGVSRCLLEVNEANRAAIGLYLGLGFTVCGRRRCYYLDGADALILGRAVDGAVSPPRSGA